MKMFKRTWLVKKTLLFDVLLCYSNILAKLGIFKRIDLIVLNSYIQVFANRIYLREKIKYPTFS